jgi:type VI secretion system secreted protein Hcp
MKHSWTRRLALPLLAGLVTSAVIAALGFADPNGPKAGGPPAATGQLIGQLSLDEGPQGVQIFSYSWGVSNPTTIGSGGGGAGSGKASFSSLNLMKNVDLSSAELLQAAADGRHYPKAVFTAQWGTGNAAAKAEYELHDVVVESVQQSGAGGSAPSESVSFDFGKIKWTFTDSSGTTTGGWNVVENKPFP